MYSNITNKYIEYLCPQTNCISLKNCSKGIRLLQTFFMLQYSVHMIFFLSFWKYLYWRKNTFFLPSWSQVSCTLMVILSSYLRLVLICVPSTAPITHGNCTIRSWSQPVNCSSANGKKIITMATNRISHSMDYSRNYWFVVSERVASHV